ncbi:hypothetical protein L3X38_031151 [Prunus dulcis]|uniref:Uncharacterized protein n=1 Tax=Prunus dulcis TaxID=3755 RepID=A0AAD4VBJ8_PRUDU|nr:hypothetical protein L3X38_031151 [Prunus dulcis]
MMIMIAQQDDNAVPSFPSVVFGRLPEFEMIPRTYFLSNGPLSRRTLTFGHWRESDLFDDIFGDGDSHYSDEETDKQVLQQGSRTKSKRLNDEVFYVVFIPERKSTCSYQSYRVPTPEKADSECWREAFARHEENHQSRSDTVGEYNTNTILEYH